MRCDLSFVVFLGLAGAASQASAQELAARATFKGHTFRVDKTALSPDGKILASAGGDTRGGELKLWDAATGKEIASLPGFTNSISALVFSPDGQRLASAGHSPVQVWDVMAHKQIHKFGDPRGEWIHTLAFSHDGKKLGWTSWRETHVWDLENGKELASWKRPFYSYGPMALSRDLATLAKADHQEIDLCDIAAGKVKATLSEHRGGVGFLSYSADGKTIVAASTWYRDHKFKYQGDVKLWDIAGRSERVSFKGPFGRISEAALSPDGKTLAVLDSPELRVIPDIKIIDVATGRQTIIRKLPSHAFTSLSFTRDGRLFVVGNSDETTVHLWQVQFHRICE
jgi:WD40 repeat protein